MSAHRVIVRAGGSPISQGTGWSLRPDLVVTAFHVVGNARARGWLHESGRDVSYHLLRGAGDELSLEPVLYDPDTDVAILRCTCSLDSAEVLTAADAAVSLGADWRAETYPGFHNGQPFTLTGRVTDVRGERSSRALQLRVNEGTQVSWDGVSGSAVCCEGRVVGIITEMTDGANTGWGASVAAVQLLERILDDRGLVAECQGLLLDLYPDPEPLLALEAALGFLPGAADRAGPPADRQTIAGRLVRRAAQEGAAGLSRLAELARHDHPTSPKVAELLARIQRCVPARQKVPEHWQHIHKVLQWLKRQDSLGVALLEPLGYGAWRVVEAVLKEVRRSNAVLLPVRLVPDRRPADEGRLYRTLLRQLREAIEEQLDPPVEHSWESVFQQETGDSFGERDRFEYTLEKLAKTAGREKRVLLLVVDDLARLPADQLETLGYLMARRCERGRLKLLVWGRRELHELRTQPSEEFSAFHQLQGIHMGPLSAPEVEDLVVERLGHAARPRAALVYAVTEGHPALVCELLRDYADDVRAWDPEALTVRLLRCMHMTRLRRTVEVDSTLQKLLGFFARHGENPLPRWDLVRGEGHPPPRRDWVRCEEQLRWLGIIKEHELYHWKWTAPLMRRFAEEWLDQDS